jgi:hypothetical protein
VREPKRYLEGDIQERVVLARYGHLLMVGDHDGSITGLEAEFAEGTPRAIRAARLVRAIEEDRAWVRWLVDNGLYVDGDGYPVHPLQVMTVPRGTTDYSSVRRLEPVVMTKPATEDEMLAFPPIDHIQLVQRRVASGDLAMAQFAGYNPYRREWYVWASPARVYAKGSVWGVWREIDPLLVGKTG